MLSILEELSTFDELSLFVELSTFEEFSTGGLDGVLSDKLVSSPQADKPAANNNPNNMSFINGNRNKYVSIAPNASDSPDINV